MMYRTHCQRILDTVVRANFGEVKESTILVYIPPKWLNLVLCFHQIQEFLLHFWQAMPPHMVGVLGCDVVVELVAVCDITLYNVSSSQDVVFNSLEIVSGFRP